MKGSVSTSAGLLILDCVAAARAQSDRVGIAVWWSRHGGQDKGDCVRQLGQGECGCQETAAAGACGCQSASEAWFWEVGPSATQAWTLQFFVQQFLTQQFLVQVSLASCAEVCVFHNCPQSSGVCSVGGLGGGGVSCACVSEDTQQNPFNGFVGLGANYDSTSVQRASSSIGLTAGCSVGCVQGFNFCAPCGSVGSGCTACGTGFCANCLGSTRIGCRARGNACSSAACGCLACGRVLSGGRPACGRAFPPNREVGRLPASETTTSERARSEGDHDQATWRHA